jgi:hypothetical protein
MSQDQAPEQGQPPMSAQQLEVEASTKDKAARNAVDAGDFVTARTLFEQELEIWRRLNRPKDILYGLVHISWVFRNGQRMVHESRPLLEEAMAIAEGTGDPLLVGVVNGNLSDLALDEGNYPEALRLAQQCLGTSLPGYDPIGTCAMLEICAMAAANLGLSRQALRLHGAAVAERQRRDALHTLPIILRKYERGLASARQALGSNGSQLAEGEGSALTLEQADTEAQELTWTPS